MAHDLHNGLTCRTVRQNGPDVGYFRREHSDASCDGDAMKVRAILFGVLLLTWTLPLGAGERMTLRVSPSVSFAPANLIVRAQIEADARNRAVEIVAESTEFYRSSEIQLDGEKAPRTNMFEFRSLPPGTYEVKATLLGPGGEARASVRQQINVIASGAAQ
jgi:hypothetical protein